MAALSIDFLEGRSQVEVCPETKAKSETELSDQWYLGPIVLTNLFKMY